MSRGVPSSPHVRGSSAPDDVQFAAGMSSAALVPGLGDALGDFLCPSGSYSPPQAACAFLQVWSEGDEKPRRPSVSAVVTDLARCVMEGVGVSGEGGGGGRGRGWCRRSSRGRDLPATRREGRRHWGSGPGEAHNIAMTEPTVAPLPAAPGIRSRRGSQPLQNPLYLPDHRCRAGTLPSLGTAVSVFVVGNRAPPPCFELFGIDFPGSGSGVVEVDDGGVEYPVFRRVAHAGAVASDLDLA